MSREFSTVEPGTIARSSLLASVSAAERRHQFADERILAIVREGEAGHRVADLCETHGISAQMYYLWKTRYGGMELGDLQQLRRRALTIRAGATTAAAVAIFLGGLVVGRSLTQGRRSESSAPAQTARPFVEPTTPESLRPEPVAAEPPAATPPAAIPTTNTAPAAGGGPDEASGRGDSGGPITQPKGEEGPPVAGRRPTERRRQSPAPAPSATPPTPTVADNQAEAPALPLDTGYAVQVAAMPDVAEADALLLRLTAKGYSAYVLSKPGPSALHRVRIGPFKTREEAQAAATRLTAEDQFRPWITK